MDRIEIDALIEKIIEVTNQEDLKIKEEGKSPITFSDMIAIHASLYGSTVKTLCEDVSGKKTEEEIDIIKSSLEVINSTVKVSLAKMEE